MAFFTGTATNLANLLVHIRDHLDDEGWAINAYTTGGAAPNPDYLYVTGPGYGTGYEVSFAIRTYTDAPNNHYCLELRAATAYDPAADWGLQPGVSPNSTFTRCWNSGMTYWLAVSDRRIVLVVKCSNTYHSMYAGYMNTFANPIEYPYPFYMAGDAAIPGPFGATENKTRSIANPGLGAAYVREPGGLWRAVAVYGDASDDFSVASASRYTMWPYMAYSSGLEFTPVYSRPPFARGAPLPGLPGSLWMMNAYIIGMTDDAGVIGALEGVYWIPGNTISAEQEFTIGSDEFIAFIAISRSIESPSQFYCVKEA